MKQTRAERKASQQGYRQSPLGRMAAKRAAQKLSDNRRLIAAAKHGVAVAKPGEFDGSAVQRTLKIWGGL